MAAKQSIAERFESKIVRIPIAGCWIWTGSLHAFGYGLFYFYHDSRTTTKTAHRMSWELHKGPIPDGLQVCHHCDVPACCNPHHLFLGTQKDNNQDRARKGRGNHPRGDAPNKVHKLTEEQARDAKRRIESGESLQSIADRYGVRMQSIYLIKIGRNWKHVV